MREFHKVVTSAFAKWLVTARKAAGYATAAPLDFSCLPPRNLDRPTKLVTVASGTTFVALDLTHAEQRTVTNALYLHIHSVSRRCYVGVTVMEMSKLVVFCF